MSNKGNRPVRELLIQKYGKRCMFRAAKIEEQLQEKKPKIKSYKKFVSEKRYKLKQIIKLEKQLTLHHLVHRSEGGATSERNGAVVSALAHQYIHSLPREEEEVINGMLRHYKECKVTVVDEVELPFDVVAFAFSIPEKQEINKKYYKRTKNKEDTKKQIEEYIDMQMEDEDER